MKISVKIGSATFPNPVTVASGTFGHAEKYYNLEEVRKLGALIPKTVTLHPREGNPPPRIVETAAGMINAIGIENAGARAFIREKLPLLKKISVPLIISILGNTDEEFLEMTRLFCETKDVAALELNLSCPNLQKESLIAQDPEATLRVIQKVKAQSSVPVIAKLSPNVTDIRIIAQAAQDAGADGVSLVNTFAAMAIDIKTRRSKIGNVTGGLSGPAIKPIALNMVYQVARKIKIPIIAMGGIMTSEDALEFIIAGATMVAVGTANFINPRAPLEVLSGIKTYLKKNRIEDIIQLVGSIRQGEK